MSSAYSLAYNVLCTYLWYIYEHSNVEKLCDTREVSITKGSGISFV